MKSFCFKISESYGSFLPWKVCSTYILYSKLNCQMNCMINKYYKEIFENKVSCNVPTGSAESC